MPTPINIFFIVSRIIEAFQYAYERSYYLLRKAVSFNKFKAGDWVYEHHCIAKVVTAGWGHYELKLYTKAGVFYFLAPKKMAEKTYKKIDKKHLKAVLIIYD